MLLEGFLLTSAWSNLIICLTLLFLFYFFKLKGLHISTAGPADEEIKKRGGFGEE